MRLTDNLGYRLFLSSSTIPNSGVGVFTGIDIAAAVPVCEYRGDIFMDDPDYISGQRMNDVMGKPYCFDVARMKERYMYTLMGGYKTLKAEYVIQHPTFNCTIDCHPALCESDIGFAGFINDRRTWEGRNGEREMQHETPIELPLQERLDLGYNVFFWALSTQPLFYLISLRDIQAGEELFVDYGYNYWSAEQAREQEKNEKVDLTSTANPKIRPQPGDIIEGKLADEQMGARRMKNPEAPSKHVDAVKSPMPVWKGKKKKRK